MPSVVAHQLIVRESFVFEAAALLVRSTKAAVTTSPPPPPLVVGKLDFCFYPRRPPFWPQNVELCRRRRRGSQDLTKPKGDIDEKSMKRREETKMEGEKLCQRPFNGIASQLKEFEDCRGRKRRKYGQTETNRTIISSLSVMGRGISANE